MLAMTMSLPFLHLEAEGMGVIVIEFSCGKEGGGDQSILPPHRQGKEKRAKEGSDGKVGGR